MRHSGAAELDDGVIVAVDGGKTKFLVAAFNTSLTELERRRIATGAVDSTLTALNAHITGIFDRYTVTSIGLSIFGPLETDPDHDDFGAIVGSSEPQWSGVNLPSALTREFGVPVFFDFDVNAGALAEGRHRRQDFIYLSMGTGVGGVLYRGRGDGSRADPPQMGHLYLPREPDDNYPGSCLFHHSCFQGLASGKAILGRWQNPAHLLAASHEAWDLEARYIARACANLLYVSSFTTILMGSGISVTPGLISRSNQYLDVYLNNFPENLARRIRSAGLIERAVLAPDSSILGAALLARNATGLRHDHGAR